MIPEIPPFWLLGWLKAMMLCEAIFNEMEERNKDR